MKFKAIIFDMDGTIVDTNTIWIRATRHVIKNRGITLSPEEEHQLHIRLTGVGIYESCKTIKEVGNLPETIEQLIDEKEGFANGLYEEGICFIKGFPEFHAQLMKHNIKTGIATNASASTVVATNKTLKLDRFFGKHIYNVNDVNNQAKPHPALYLHAAEKLEVLPYDCIAIEDSAHGVQAAKNAGMFCIGINTGRDRLQLKKADLIIDGYHQINLQELLKKPCP